MRLRRTIGQLYNALLSIQVLAGFSAVLVGGVQKADANSLAKIAAVAPEVQRSLAWLQTSAWWLLPSLLVVSGGLGLLKKLLGPPWLWNTVHSYLDSFREEAFNVGSDDAEHHHRVTLFRYRSWRWRFCRWPWSGWLVPVERSGHTTQASVSVYRAPDDADRAEGVAGMTWARRKVVNVTNLPDLSDNPSREDMQRYAKASGMTLEAVRKKLPKARSFCGIPVETKAGVWGVLILDSRSADGINANSQTLYRPLGKFLAKLLERV
jgi:hypothetical protein